MAFVTDRPRGATHHKGEVGSSFKDGGPVHSAATVTQGENRCPFQSTLFIISRS